MISAVVPPTRKTMSFLPIEANTDTVLRFPGRLSASPVSPLRSPVSPLLPVLIVLHQETSTPGRVGNALRALGHGLDVRRPRFGDPLPETLDDHAGAVIFGGPMSANDADGFVRREIDWIAVPLREQRPFLGICLGAQMLAKQLGAKAARRSDIIRSGRPRRAMRPAPAGPTMSITGTARDLSCRPVPNCSRREATFRCRRSRPATPSASSSIPT
jgi:hypothetical protein